VLVLGAIAIAFACARPESVVVRTLDPQRADPWAGRTRADVEERFGRPQRTEAAADGQLVLHYEITRRSVEMEADPPTGPSATPSERTPRNEAWGRENVLVTVPAATFWLDAAGVVTRSWIHPKRVTKLASKS
jgi:hypothetical protein